MKFAKLSKWVSVNKNMNKDFRERVVNVALTHLPMASEDLRLRAQHELNKAVQIPRYKFADAPFKLQYRYTLEKFENKNIVASIVINLWAEAQFDTILSLRNQALQKSFRLSNVQRWEWNLDGFFVFDELGKFNEFCYSYVADKSEDEKNDILLAELWLSPFYIQSLEESTASLATPAKKEAVSNVVSEYAKVQDMQKEVPSSEVPITDLMENTVPEVMETQEEDEEDVQDVGLEDLEQEIKKELSIYTSVKKRLEVVLLQANKSLREEASARPELSVDLSFFEIETENVETKVNFVQETIKQIRTFDKHKSDWVSRLEKSLANIATLRDEVKEWSPESMVNKDFGERLGYRDLTIPQLKSIHSEMQKEISRLQAEQNQFREARVNSIKNLVSLLVDAKHSLDTDIEGISTLEEFSRLSISDWEIAKLKRTEQQLAQRFQEVSRQADKNIANLISVLMEDNSQQSHVDLLEALSKEKRDIEVYLLALAVNASRSSLKNMPLSKGVLKSIINGLEQFPKQVNPFVLLNYSAPFLFAGLKTSETISAIEICVLLLTAKYAGQFDIPADLLWEIAEWPEKKMPTWGKVWEGVLMDQPLEISFDGDGHKYGQMVEARTHATQSLAKEYGSFVKLASIKSRRHITMLRIHILPKLSEIFDEVTKIDSLLESSGAPYEKQKSLVSLEKMVISKLTTDFNEEAIVELYEHAIAHEKINDTDAFHRRASIKLISEMSGSILEYAEALLGYWSGQLSDDGRIRYSDLEKELTSFKDFTNFTLRAFKSLVSLPTARQTLDTGKIESALKNILTAEILTQSIYLPQFTHLVAELVKNEPTWETLSANLLEDIKDPFDLQAAFTYLMENQAPNQILMFAQHLALDQQRAAQELKRAKEREVEKIENDLMRFGGNLSDLLQNKDLGRWTYIISKTEKVLAELKTEFEAQIVKTQNQARQVRTEINEVDNIIFDAKDSIPVDSFQILKRCMDLARHATEKNELIPAVQEFLKEIHYRFDHNSWPTEDLRDLEDKLKNLSIADETMLRKKQFGANELLAIFDAGDINKLGLTLEDISVTSINTRAEVLRSWLKIKSGTGFLVEKQSSGLRLAIQNLFRYFTQMLTMKKSLDPQGRHIAYESPFIYSYWDLSYPKTSVLDVSCVFVTIPGNPPSPEDISAFEDKMEQGEWLDYYFVFLFLPGSTAKIRQRLQASYKNKRLVVFDEATLLNVILAEQQSKNPVGALRPLMINTLKTQTIDVFKVSNLVDSYSSIFVGRDSQIEQIVSSASNYAIYGGRRIGKSSVMNAIEKRLIKKGAKVVSHDFQGEGDVSDVGTSAKIARKLGIEKLLIEHGDFKSALDNYLENNPDVEIVLMLDEIDKYIVENPTRHILIETCRAMSDRHPGQFRVIIAGFMKLYDYLEGKSPYTPISDPWRRMFNKKLLNNLSPVNAEEIVKVGFLHILGWEFENRSIPLKIVELTGGHPAFVQMLCQKIQEKVGIRNDRIVKLDDIQTVFDDKHPSESFIAFVRNTLKMNLDPIGRYLIVWLASESKDALGFTWKEILEYASLSEVPIPEKRLEKSVHRLVVTNVIRDIASQVYEFSVPDYPNILNQLNDSAQLKSLFDEMVVYLQKDGDSHD